MQVSHKTTCNNRVKPLSTNRNLTNSCKYFVKWNRH